jgi:hypothetical protein
MATNLRYHVCLSVIALPLCVLAYLYIDESARWLTQHGRVDAAHVVLVRMARVNRRPVPAHTYLWKTGWGVSVHTFSARINPAIFATWQAPSSPLPRITGPQPSRARRAHCTKCSTTTTATARQVRHCSGAGAYWTLFFHFFSPGFPLFMLRFVLYLMLAANIPKIRVWVLAEFCCEFCEM